MRLLRRDLTALRLVKAVLSRDADDRPRTTYPNQDDAEIFYGNMQPRSSAATQAEYGIVIKSPYVVYTRDSLDFAVKDRIVTDGGLCCEIVSLKKCRGHYVLLTEAV